VTYRDIVDVDEVTEQDRLAGENIPKVEAARPALLGFTALELRVIALAREDGLGSIEEPGLLERVIAFTFGLRTNRRALADPRLEALRQAVVIARHRHHLPDACATRLQSFGFTLRQIRTIETRAVAG
jgi:hypothetical protein